MSQKMSFIKYFFLGNCDSKPLESLKLKVGAGGFSDL